VVAAVKWDHANNEGQAQRSGRHANVGRPRCYPEPAQHSPAGDQSHMGRTEIVSKFVARNRTAPQTLIRMSLKQ
jgi:hypothetical protein